MYSTNHCLWGFLELLSPSFSLKIVTVIGVPIVRNEKFNRALSKNNFYYSYFFYLSYYL